jgi:homoserine kinase
MYLSNYLFIYAGLPLQTRSNLIEARCTYMSQTKVMRSVLPKSTPFFQMKTRASQATCFSTAAEAQQIAKAVGLLLALTAEYSKSSFH